MSDQPALPLADAVETFVASLRQLSVPLNTIKSYAHDLRLFVQAVPADLVLIQKNGDYEVEASFTENEVASSNATGLIFCNVEWKQRPDNR